MELRNIHDFSETQLTHIHKLNDHLYALTRQAVERYERMVAILKQYPDLFESPYYDVQIYLELPDDIYFDKAEEQFKNRVGSLIDYDICVSSPENPYRGSGMQGYLLDYHAIKLCRGFVHFFINQNILSIDDIMRIKPDWFDFYIKIHI